MLMWCQVGHRQLSAFHVKLRGFAAPVGAMLFLATLTFIPAQAFAQDAETRRAARERARSEAHNLAQQPSSFVTTPGQDVNLCVLYEPPAPDAPFNMQLTNKCDFRVNLSYWDASRTNQSPVSITLSPGKIRLNAGLGIYRRFAYFGCRAPERPREKRGSASANALGRARWSCS